MGFNGVQSFGLQGGGGSGGGGGGSLAPVIQFIASVGQTTYTNALLGAVSNVAVFVEGSLEDTGEYSKTGSTITWTVVIDNQRINILY